MAYQLESLTDRVKKLLGGAIQQAPQTLRDIGQSLNPREISPVPQRINYKKPDRTVQALNVASRVLDPFAKAQQNIQQGFGTFAQDPLSAVAGNIPGMQRPIGNLQGELGRMRIQSTMQRSKDPKIKQAGRDLTLNIPKAQAAGLGGITLTSGRQLMQKDDRKLQRRIETMGPKIGKSQTPLGAYYSTTYENLSNYLGRDNEEAKLIQKAAQGKRLNEDEQKRLDQISITEIGLMSDGTNKVSKKTRKALDPLLKEARKYKSAELTYLRNPEKSPQMGDKFGQNIEPAGKYINLMDKGQTYVPPGWETGKVTFKNPLVVDWGDGYKSGKNWKNVLSDKYGGKTGKELSKAIVKDGYDGIITLDKGVPSETVSLTDIYNKATKQPTLKVGGVKGEDVITQAKKQIGRQTDEPGKGLRETVHDFYTQSVDRFHPLTRASGQVKKTLKQKGAELRPEYDPEFLVRRLTGAGGIADHRFKTELDPIIKQADEFKIPKADLDVYLANRRMVGFGKAGRDIYGVDVKKSKQVIDALETKHGDSIKQVADQLYKYQDKGLKEMVDAGFITKADATAMRGQNPDYSPLYRVMDEVDEYLGLPTRKTMQGTQPIMRIKGSTKKIQSPLESIIGNTYSHRAAIEKNRVAQSIINLQKMADMGFEKVTKSGNDTLTVWNNGSKEYWKVGKDIADVAKGANEENMNLLLKLAKGPAQILRQGATGRNPAFMIPNIVRDQLDAGITSKYGYIPFIDYVSGLKSMLTNDNVFKSWQESGAKIDLGEMSGSKDVAKYLDEKTAKKGLRQWITGALDAAGKYSEQPTRVGLHKRALKKTGNPLLAMMESRDATVDFARMGTKMKTANSIIPFLNVSVQGFDKLIRSVRDRPGRVIATMTLYGTIPAVTTTLYNLSNYPEAYQNIPDYVKESNFVIVTGINEDGSANYLTYPKGNIVPIAANPTMSFIEHLYGQDEESFKELALNVISGTLPVLGQGSTTKEIGIKTVGQNLPQAAKPTVESIMNKSFYKYDPKKDEAGKDQSIVPFWMKDRPAHEQHHGKYTPKAYQKIGAVLNVSPLHVKNWVEGTFSGYASIPVKITEILSKASEGEDISQNDVPLLRRFYKQTWDLPKYEKQEKAEVPGMLERLGLDQGPKAVEASESTIKVKGEETTEPTMKIKDMPEKDAILLYKELTKDAKSLKTKQDKVRIGMGAETDTTESVSQERGDTLIKLKDFKSQAPEIVFKADLETYESGGGMKVEERGQWAYTALGGAKDEKDAQQMINQMWEAGVLTTSKSGVAQWLKDEYGINVYNYTGTDKDVKKKVSSGSGKKKAAKVTLGRVSTPAMPGGTIKFGKIAPLKMKKAPKITLGSLTTGQKDYRIKV